jgi:uncharacterized protein (TIGR02652 family)
MQEYPLFGPEIPCPHCQQIISALILTDIYLCPLHGPFEVNPHTGELVHLNSEHRRWKLWEGKWYRQHQHPDGLRFEIHESLDRSYSKGLRASKITIADRYRDLIGPALDQNHKLFGLPVTFSEPATLDSRWGVINFELEHEPFFHKNYPYFRCL